MNQLTDVLRAIWARQVPEGEKPYFFISTKRVADDEWKDRFFQWPDMEKLRGLLRKYGTDEYNLYFCPLPFSEPHRRREYVMGSNLLWADIDDTDPGEMTVKPHVLWESSPGRWAGLWAVARWLERSELEKYNKRMTYGVGADKAGWDLTQVLRIPGTRNHKYRGGPLGRMVRMSWKDKLSLKDIPELGDVSKRGAGSAIELYAKWKPKLKGTTRQILTAKVAGVGKRSEVLWKLYHQLFDAGVPLDEIRVLVRESAWNKYRGRRDEEKQLDRDIGKCLAEKLDERRETDAGSGGGLVGLRDEIYEGLRADGVKCAEVNWLWWPYISRGALTIVEGDPGLGKSYFMQIVAGAVCDGSSLPGEGGLKGMEKIKRGSVYYFSIEDDAATTIVPRLKKSGVKSLERYRIYDRKLTMDEEGLAVAEYLVEKHKPALVVFDTLNYFIGGIDMHRANEVSQQLEHFARLAKNFGIAVVLLRHLTKSSTGTVKAAYRGQGSIAFTGTAREVLTVGLHPEDHELRVVAVTKLNIEAKPKAIGFRIGAGGFEWSKDFYDLTSDDIIDVRASGSTTKDDAIDFLKKELSDGPVESDELAARAKKAGIVAASLRRAKTQLKVVAVKKGYDPVVWFWKLPQT